MNTSKDLNYRLFLQRESGFIRTAFQTEFERYAAVQEGNLEQVRRNFQISRENFLVGKGVLSKDPVKNIRYHVIIAAAMFARICVEGGLPHDTAYTLSDIYIQRADLCNDTDGLIDLLGEMQLDFTTQMHQLRREHATSIHVRKCIDFIYEHLNEKLTLTELADTVHLTPNYLSKLFLKETGQSVKEFVLHSKIQTAQNMLKYSEITSLDIALALGFSSQSAFIAAFHQLCGMTPRQYRCLHFHKELADAENKRINDIRR